LKSFEQAAGVTGSRIAAAMSAGKAGEVVAMPEKRE
jgi:hypothetical protein